MYLTPCAQHITDQNNEATVRVFNLDKYSESGYGVSPVTAVACGAVGPRYPLLSLLSVCSQGQAARLVGIRLLRKATGQLTSAWYQQLVRVCVAVEGSVIDN